ncbi:hypothetical protein J5U23_00213 [Saccharolobus shibatae B12]|uniref:Uncharacterized protein n=1 Tax=Saccharolobus shibatae (strain ATCC 51178 / DSM 5389 / JCM 8931 / NBRC 15437 / B12) TaxID=523848 RepID=A0A8F5GS27_SACSH|nr:hypothetical protein J5U23_00213 [Saccharolobus shibatae B12]
MIAANFIEKAISKYIHVIYLGKFFNYITSPPRRDTSILLNLKGE